MTINERNELFREFFENECMATMTAKGGDYAGDSDANQNFKRIAAILGLSKYQVWSVYFNKHVDAVNNSIKRTPERPERQAEGIKESLKDIINYAGILLSMLEEDKLVTRSEGSEADEDSSENTPQSPLKRGEENKLPSTTPVKQDTKQVFEWKANAATLYNEWNANARTLMVNGEEKEIRPFIEKGVDPELIKQEEHICKCQEADCCQGGGDQS